MKRELRDKWCAALRSGEYKQGKGSLKMARDDRPYHHEHVEYGYCCLGVLCVIDGTIEAYSADDEKAQLEYSELPTMEHLIRMGLNYDVASNLASRNDDNTTFSKIADLIEEWVPVDD